MMSEKNDEEDKDMPIVAKKIDKYQHMGLTPEKKKKLKEHMGSVTHKIDLNRVKDWWKNEKN
jgi:hypothetical protein